MDQIKKRKLRETKIRKNKLTKTYALKNINQKQKRQAWILEGNGKRQGYHDLPQAS